MDLFRSFDKDGSGSVSRSEFIRGLEVVFLSISSIADHQGCGIMLEEELLDELLEHLDEDGDGEIDYKVTV